MPHFSEWSAQEEFAPASTSAGEARAFVRRELGTQALSYLTGDIELVVSELVTNAVLHARTSLVVVIAGTPGCVTLTVHDGSWNIPVMRVAEPSDTGGRGMSIVAACSTGWGTTIDVEGHKSVWATFGTPTTTAGVI